MDNVEEDFFETPDLDDHQVIDHGHDLNAVGNLRSYVTDISWDTFDEEDFREFLNDAKREIRTNVYSLDSSSGFLDEELKAFRWFFDRIPFYSSLAAFAMAAVASLVVFGGAMTGASDNMSKLVAASVIGLGSTGISLVLGLVGSVAAWGIFYRGGEVGRQRLLKVRNYIFYIYETTLRQLRNIADERAVNEEPKKGATGLLQSQVVYRCNYELDRTVDRCKLYFDIKLDRVEIDSVGDRTKMWVWAAIAIGVSAALLSVGPMLDTENLLSGNLASFNEVALLMGGLLVPVLSGLVTHHLLAKRATGPNSFMARRREMIKEAFEAVPSDQFLTEIGFTPEDHDQFDYSAAHTNVQMHAEWFYGALTRFEKLKNRIIRE